MRHYWFVLSSPVQSIHWADLFGVTAVTFRHKGHKEVASKNSVIGEKGNIQGLIMTR